MPKLPILLLFITQLSFINNSFATFINGNIITNDNEELRVTLQIPTNIRNTIINYVQLQNKLKYFDDNGSVITVKPDEIKEFNFVFKGEKIVMKSLMDKMNLNSVFNRSPKIFLKEEVSGELNLYSYIASSKSVFSNHHNLGINTKHYIFKFNEGELFYISDKQNKSEVLKSYMGKCKRMIQRINSDYYTKLNEKLIVTDYNSICGSE